MLMGGNMTLDDGSCRARSCGPEDRPVREHEDQASLMTPVRRAALDALEREFSDILVRPRT